jgi:hypothetical protein
VVAWRREEAAGGCVEGGCEEGVVVLLFFVRTQGVAFAEVPVFVFVGLIDRLDAVWGAIEGREVVGAAGWLVKALGCSRPIAEAGCGWRRRDVQRRARP